MRLFDRAFSSTTGPSGVRWALIIVPLLVFAGLLWLVRSQAIQSLDEHVLLALQGVRSPGLDRFFLAVTAAGGAGRYLPATLLALFFWRRGRRQTAVSLALAVGGGQLLSWAVKYLVNRPRPDLVAGLIAPDSPSFPSGHALGAAVLYGWLVLWLWPRGRRPAGLWLLLLIAGVALSRVYLGVHYPSDVLASLALAIPWLVIVSALTRRPLFGRDVGGGDAAIDEEGSPGHE